VEVRIRHNESALTQVAQFKRIFDFFRRSRCRGAVARADEVSWIGHIPM
jgi:hypothetical protein